MRSAFLTLAVILASPASAQLARPRSIDVTTLAPVDVHVSVMDSRLGTLHDFVGWSATRTTFGTWVVLQRERNGLRERYFAEREPPRPGMLGMLAGAAPVADAERCRTAGECDVTLLPGLTWPRQQDTGSDDYWEIEVRRDVRLHHIQRVCRVGHEIVWLRRPASGGSWLDPIGVDLSEEHTFLPARLVRVGVGQAVIEPPECTLEPGARTTVIGGQPTGSSEPPFGLFLVRPTDMPAIVEASRSSMRAAFEHAEHVAVRSFTGVSRWCEDPVRVTLGVGGGTPGMPLVGTPVDDRRALMRLTRNRAALLERVNEWNLRMYRRHEPDVCAQSLDRMLEALRLAQRQRLVVLHFGY